MRDCENMRELISLYLDGALGADETAKIEEHLAGCEECSRFLSSYSLFKDGIPDDVEPPAELLSGVMAGVREINAEKKKKKRPALILRWTAIAASFAIVTFAGISLMNGGFDAGSAVANEAALSPEPGAAYTDRVTDYAQAEDAEPASDEIPFAPSTVPAEAPEIFEPSEAAMPDLEYAGEPEPEPVAEPAQSKAEHSGNGSKTSTPEPEPEPEPTPEPEPIPEPEPETDPEPPLSEGDPGDPDEGLPVDDTPFFGDPDPDPDGEPLPGPGGYGEPEPEPDGELDPGTPLDEIDDEVTCYHWLILGYYDGAEEKTVALIRELGGEIREWNPDYNYYAVYFENPIEEEELEALCEELLKNDYIWTAYPKDEP